MTFDVPSLETARSSLSQLSPYLQNPTFIIRIVLTVLSIIIMALVMGAPGLCTIPQQEGASYCADDNYAQIGWWNSEYATNMKMEGVWGQMAVILGAPLCAFGALTMSVLTNFKAQLGVDVDVTPFEGIYLVLCAVFHSILVILEFFYALAFFDIMMIVNSVNPSGMIQVRGWIAAAVFLLISMILYSADAHMTRRKRRIEAEANQQQLRAHNPASQYAPDQSPAQQSAPNPYQGQQNPAMHYPQAGQYPPQGQYPQNNHYPPQGQYPMGNQYPQEGQYSPPGQYPLMNQSPPPNQYGPNLPLAPISQSPLAPPPPPQVDPANKA
ncbi:hypothetical protein L596_028833 [Steinernema carpocapsae]|uniref:Uncharacterized protein n=1 Tax=Steinernema carpocapsae TaxID=34508 RepID=A0A4U5LZH6_STECR|nr:hypothetical protein L596_028833 [Steinernema carpocapsae]